MSKTICLILISLIPVFLFSTCGKDGNTVDVCNAAIEKMYDVCDFDDAGDQELISDILLAFDYYVSASQVSTLTENEAKQECTLDEGEEDIASDTKDEIMEALEDVVTCDDLAEGAEQYAYLF